MSVDYQIKNVTDELGAAKDFLERLKRLDHL